jgi:putative transposase
METLRAKRQKKPKHTTQTRAFVFALDVDEQELASLHAVRAACWEVRNKLTEERRQSRPGPRSEGETRPGSKRG